jgi:hypothetical protein
MKRLTRYSTLMALLVAALPAFAQDADDAVATEVYDVDEVAEEQAVEEQSVNEPQGDGIKSPKAMSGMSILGNEEAPKALVIIPWKSSEMGDDLSLSDTLDDRAQPVDKDVFLRQLRFYEIRSGQ